MRASRAFVDLCAGDQYGIVVSGSSLAALSLLGMSSSLSPSQLASGSYCSRRELVHLSPTTSVAWQTALAVVPETGRTKLQPSHWVVWIRARLVEQATMARTALAALAVLAAAAAFAPPTTASYHAPAAAASGAEGAHERRRHEARPEMTDWETARMGNTADLRFPGRSKRRSSRPWAAIPATIALSFYLVPLAPASPRGGSTLGAKLTSFAFCPWRLTTAALEGLGRGRSRAARGHERTGHHAPGTGPRGPRRDAGPPRRVGGVRGRASGGARAPRRRRPTAAAAGASLRWRAPPSHYLR